MTASEILEMSAVRQAALVRGRDVSAAELLEMYLPRIHRHDGALHAFVSLFEQRARRRAAAVDRALTAGRRSDRSLVGVPLGVKDTEAVRWSFYRAGSRAYRWVWSPADGAAVRCFRRSGVTIVGKTSTSELALMPVVETDLHPPTANPWNPEYTAGGSSGGSAAAVAGGLVTVAHAADGAGSIRIPASLCHLFGFKPSRGCTPNFYRAFDPVGIAVMGSVTNHVEDSAALLDALAGRTAHPAPPESFLAACARPPRKGLRVGVCVDSPLIEVQPDVAAAVWRVAALLEEMGHEVEQVDGSHGATIDDFIPVYGRVIATPPVPSERKLQPVTQWIRRQGRTISRAEARTRAAALADQVLAVFGDHDLLLTPTVAGDPPKVGAWKHLDPESEFRAAMSLGAFTAQFNLSGQPAASIPAGLSTTGLPIGVQIAARQGEDSLLFQVAAELERALRWTEHRSPTFLAD